MKIDKLNLYYKTQSPKFLFSMVLVIIVLGVIISSLVNISKKDIIIAKSMLNNLYQLQFNELSSDIYKEELSKVLSNPKVPMEELLNFMETISTIENPNNIKPSKTIEITISQLEKFQETNNAYVVIISFLKTKLDKEHLIELIKFTEQNPPTKYSNRLLAYHYLRIQKDAQKAIACLKQETSLKESDSCKNLLVMLLIQVKDIKELEELAKDPSFNLFKDKISEFLFLEKKTWTLLFKSILLSQFNVKVDGILLLTLLTGFIWFGIWLHALKPENIISTSLLCFVAFVLGVFSTSITIFIIYLEEHHFHLSQGESTIQGILYFILGVGLREEFSKLLVFLVLIPILVKRQNPLEWLIIPGMVGLGFATEENLNYFLKSGGVSLPARFLTANFFHVALTALAGESICHYFNNRSRGPQHFLSTFSMVIIMHGLYNAFIVVPLLTNVHFFSIIILIYFSFLFFNRLKTLRSRERESISLSTHFIFGLTILFMSTFIYLSFQGGHFYAFNRLAEPFIQFFVIIYMFLYVMPNSIIKI